MLVTIAPVFPWWMRRVKGCSTGLGRSQGNTAICFWTVINLWMRSVWIIRWTMRMMWDNLNYLGNQKYTKYLGTYIKEHYTVSDPRADAAYESWQKNADYIREMIVNPGELKESGDMETISEKLQNPNYWVFISVDDSCNGEIRNCRGFLARQVLGCTSKRLSGGSMADISGKILNATGAGYR